MLKGTQVACLTFGPIGNVVFEEGVEVGANSTIDRGSIANTKIGLILGNYQKDIYCFRIMETPSTFAVSK